MLRRGAIDLHMAFHWERVIYIVWSKCYPLRQVHPILWWNLGSFPQAPESSFRSIDIALILCWSMFYWSAARCPYPSSIHDSTPSARPFNNEEVESQPQTIALNPGDRVIESHFLGRSLCSCMQGLSDILIRAIPFWYRTVLTGATCCSTPRTCYVPAIDELTHPLPKSILNLVATPFPIYQTVTVPSRIWYNLNDGH